LLSRDFGLPKPEPTQGHLYLILFARVPAFLASRASHREFTDEFHFEAVVVALLTGTRPDGIGRGVPASLPLAGIEHLIFGVFEAALAFVRANANCSAGNFRMLYGYDSASVDVKRQRVSHRSKCHFDKLVRLELSTDMRYRQVTPGLAGIPTGRFPDAEK